MKHWQCQRCLSQQSLQFASPRQSLREIARLGKVPLILIERSQKGNNGREKDEKCLDSHQDFAKKGHGRRKRRMKSNLDGNGKHWRHTERGTAKRAVRTQPSNHVLISLSFSPYSHNPANPHIKTNMTQLFGHEAMIQMEREIRMQRASMKVPGVNGGASMMNATGAHAASVPFVAALTGLPLGHSQIKPYHSNHDRQQRQLRRHFSQRTQQLRYYDEIVPTANAGLETDDDEAQEMAQATPFPSQLLSPKRNSRHTSPKKKKQPSSSNKLAILAMPRYFVTSAPNSHFACVMHVEPTPYSSHRNIIFESIQHAYTHLEASSVVILINSKWDAVDICRATHECLDYFAGQCYLWQRDLEKKWRDARKNRREQERARRESAERNAEELQNLVNQWVQQQALTSTASRGSGGAVKLSQMPTAVSVVEQPAENAPPINETPRKDHHYFPEPESGPTPIVGEVEENETPSHAGLPSLHRDASRESLQFVPSQKLHDSSLNLSSPKNFLPVVFPSIKPKIKRQLSWNSETNDLRVEARATWKCRLSIDSTPDAWSEVQVNGAHLPKQEAATHSFSPKTTLNYVVPDIFKLSQSSKKNHQRAGETNHQKAGTVKSSKRTQNNDSEADENNYRVPGMRHIILYPLDDGSHERLVAEFERRFGSEQNVVCSTLPVDLERREREYNKEKHEAMRQQHTKYIPYLRDVCS
uniref:Uncharacterized protein n=1 Tax=Percolomonas cosmopolitus TaxID=63605 RepID=A0A7S1KR77_9EUKA|mmetsp:Transcript_5825/g.22110  ORF Transcript_5825/g.22110 Transcript_5825/m.22110 type:complete len:700 (+) Transcript_5825:217-2316(+)